MTSFSTRRRHRETTEVAQIILATKWRGSRPPIGDPDPSTEVAGDLEPLTEDLESKSLVDSGSWPPISDLDPSTEGAGVLRPQWRV
ncbi:hypothetical protein CRG98_023278 [Punica granatum]|uniref:Uncharacterized protein n=1 Tax=Punica granatum TaxID=22663 RepID=A0A2I0JJ13_PUNGR|nr:hypothetical protein CRG98_023278 [Punica granatum]